MAGWIKMPLGTEVGFVPDDIVIDGAHPLPRKKGHGYCGQTVGWINMLLGTEVGLSSGHIVRVRWG